MHDVTFRTNVDAAKRFVGDLTARHTNLNPMVGDTIVLHRSYGKIIQMVVCGRTWDVTKSGTELEIELTTPPGMSITQFTAHVRECGFSVHP